MNTFLNGISHLFILVLNMSLTAGIVILAVLALRLLLRRAPRIFSYALWAVVLFRLLCPVSFSSHVSLLGLLPAGTAEEGRMAYIREENILPQDTGGRQDAPALSEEGAGHSSPVSLSNPPRRLIQAGACLWLLGVLVLLAHGALSCARLRKLLKNAVPADEENASAAGETSSRRIPPAKDSSGKHGASAAERPRVCRICRIYRISGFGTPFVCGIFRPRIYLPADLDMAQADYMILHEQIHIRRGDHIFRLLACLALCLHWFNPLVWLANSLSIRDMEMSCDEAVLKQAGESIKKPYSASLLSLAAGGDGIRGVPLAFGEREPESRIKNVLRWHRTAVGTVVVILLICLLAAVLLLANPPASDAPAPEAELTAELLQNGTVPDGEYLIYARSVSRSARGLDLYAVEDWPEGEELPFLAFDTDCLFLVNRDMEHIRYEKTDFNEFAGLLADGTAYWNPPVHAVFTNGLISQASLESAFYGKGISYAGSGGTDTWYDDLPSLTGLPTGSDALETYYQLARSETADISDAKGTEQIDIYTGNIGDGNSGIVLIRLNGGKGDSLLYSLSAHASRAGWNNIYTGTLNEGTADETGYLMTVHIENRDAFGEYSYQVFRLDEECRVLQIAGSSFTFDRSRIGYDDDLFRQWCAHLDGWLENSHLLLSSQEGELRTDPVSDAGRYSCETLRPWQ